MTEKINEGKHETHNAMTISVGLTTYLATMGADANMYMWGGILFAVCYLATIAVVSRYGIKKMLLGFKRKPKPYSEQTIPADDSPLFKKKYLSVSDKPVSPSPRKLKEDEQPPKE